MAKSRPSMVCFVNGCHNRGGHKGDSRSYFRIPKVITCQGEKTEELSTRRRREWKAAVNRKKDFTDYSRVCSDHFISGKSAALYDVNNPDWVPTLLLSEADREADKSTQDEGEFSPPCSKKARYERIQGRKEMADRLSAADSLVKIGIEDHSTTEVEPVQTQEDDEDYKEKYERLLRENVALTKRVNELEINENCFKDNDNLVNYYTGLPTWVSLMIVFNCVEDAIPCGVMSKLSKFQKFVMVLMKLRLNLQNQDLGVRFGVSPSSISSTFKTILHVLYKRLDRFIIWPERDQLRKTMPLSFRVNFGTSVAVIVDCFEIFMERPSNLMARAQTWSNYKHHNTLKYFIGICPQGAVTFISRGWGGRTSDKHILENSGFLKYLLPDDVVLADRGFDVRESVGLMCARVVIPAFTKGKKQLSAFEIESTRKIANSRVHVERVIGLVRNKYIILRSKLPIDYSIPDSDGNLVIDKMVMVACALCNISSSIIPLE